MHHPLIAGIFVAASVTLAIVCSLGLGIMSKPLEQLHFSSPVTSLSAALIVLAVWIDDPSWQSRLKVLLVAILLFAMNSMLSHSTARAIRIRTDKHFEPRPDDHIPVITPQNPTGMRH